MSHSDLEAKDLAVRVRRLEALNRRLSLFGILGLLVASVFVIAGARHPDELVKTVEAERFVLRDHQGRVRAEIQMHDGEPILALCDENHHDRITLGTGKNGASSLCVFDAHGNVRTTVGIDGQGRAGLSVNDSHETTRGMLTTVADGMPLMQFANKEGDERLRVAMTKEATPEMILYDQDGTERVNLAVTAEKGTFLSMSDPKVEGQIVLVVDRNEGTSVGVRNAHGAYRGGVGMTLGGQSYADVVGSDESRRIQIASGRDGSMNLIFFDSNKQSRAALGIRPGGSPGFGLFDDKHKPLVEFPHPGAILPPAPEPFIGLDGSKRLRKGQG